MVYIRFCLSSRWGFQWWLNALIGTLPMIQLGEDPPNGNLSYDCLYVTDPPINVYLWSFGRPAYSLDDENFLVHQIQIRVKLKYITLCVVH